MAVVQGELWTGLAISASPGTVNHGLPLSSYYYDGRTDYIILAADLTALGFIANATITELRIWQQTRTSGASIPGVRVALKHTTRTSQGSNSFTASTDQYSTYTEKWSGTLTVQAAATWYSFPFTTPFVWDGTSHVMVSLVKDTTETYYDDNGNSQWRTMASDRMKRYQGDNTLAFPFDGGGAVSSNLAPRTYLVGDDGATSGATVINASAALSGSGSLTASPVNGKRVSAALSGVGSLTANAVNVKRVTSALAAAGSLTAEPVNVNRASAELTGVGSSSFEPAAIMSNESAGALLQGSGSLTAEPRITIFAEAQLSGVGSSSFQATTGTIINVSASLSGVGSSSLVPVNGKFVSAALAGVGSSDIRSRIALLVSSALAGAGTSSFIGGVLISAESNLSGVGTSAFVARMTYPGAPEIIDETPLKGMRTLTVHLIGQRELTTMLRGERELTVPLRGEINVPAIQDLEIYVGESKVIPVTVTDNGVAVNLTGETVSVKYVIKRSVSSATNDIAKQNGSGIVITDAANGVCTITLEPAETRLLKPGVYYYHELQVIDSVGHANPVLKGEVTVLASAF